MSNDPKPPAASDGADPSMEEILASIRRILNEDDAPAAQPDAEETETNDDDVLILDQSMMVPTAGPPDNGPGEAEPDRTRPEVPAPEHFAPPEHLAAPEHFAAPERPLAPEPPATSDFFNRPTSELVAPEAAAAAASSVGSLVRTLTAGRATHVYAGGPTLEDLVRAELRPLLKEWLDANLPPMVERLVRIEIERVVGRVVP